MSTNTLETPAAGAEPAPNPVHGRSRGPSLGEFLRDRRARLRPEGVVGRRRTPGLRREEIAARAGVSVTWYTWLEQGRGGPPSSAVLERLARALELDPPGREVLFLLAQRRPPLVRTAPPPQVRPQVQRVLDAMPLSPAFVKTSTWDIVAWNAAAAAVLADYATLPPRERNVLRRMFSGPAARMALHDWETNARFAVQVFRMDVARMGGSPEADALTAELLAHSEDFRRIWAENELRSHGVGSKRFDDPEFGPLNLESAAFDLDGAEGLSMIVLTPVTPDDVRTLEKLLARGPRRA